jgi:hypothetical protein
MKKITTQIPTKEIKKNYWRIHIKDMEEIDTSIQRISKFIDYVLSKHEDLREHFDKHDLDCDMDFLEHLMYESDTWSKL